MKPAIAGLLCLLLIACHQRQPDSASARLDDTSRRQLADAEALQDEYIDCVDDLNHKTAVEKYADKATRREVVLESCRDVITRFTVVQEQAYDNACRAEGKGLPLCDGEAVSKAKRDTNKLIQQAREQIDRTGYSPAIRYPQ